MKAFNLKLFFNIYLYIFAFNSELKLQNPIYQKTSCFGHFGRSEFSWEEPKKIVF